MKYFLTFLLSIILSINLQAQNKISVESLIPDTIEVGVSFKVIILIKKSNIRSLGGFIQYLPDGFTATKDNSGKANFKFENQNVYFSWSKLPKTEEIAISYIVKVADDLKGVFQIDGEFYYMKNNKRITTNTQPNIIFVKNPNPHVFAGFNGSLYDENALYSDGSYINDEIKNIYANLPSELRGNNCKRQIPFFINGNNEILVILLVTRDPNVNSITIEEQIPEGFHALVKETEKASFSFKDQKARFYGTRLSRRPYFTVAYRLIPDKSKNLEDLTISGTFSYQRGDLLNRDKIVETEIKSQYITNPELLDALLDSKNNKTRTSDKQNKYLSENTKTEQEVDIEYEMETGEQNDQAQIETKSGTQLNYETKENRTIRTEINNVSKDGIYFRVQIAAGHRDVESDHFLTKEITDEVITEKIDGWKKYSIKIFSDYESAKEYRDFIHENTQCKDAFIVAYNKEKRISVRVALEALNLQ
jgi:hypothetical protein